MKHDIMIYHDGIKRRGMSKFVETDESVSKNLLNALFLSSIISLQISRSAVWRMFIVPYFTAVLFLIIMLFRSHLVE